MAKIQDITTPLLQFEEGAAASTPASGVVRIYAKTDGLLYSKDDAGAETQLGGGMSGVTASAAELNILDGATLSTAELNVLDGITASTAELNIMDGVTLTATQINDSVNEFMIIAVSDESTAITTGTAKVTFRAPYAMTLYQIPRASLSTASTSGNPAIDINVSGTSIFSTTLTIDANEKTSTTAATAAVMTSSTISVSDDAEITIDIDTAGTGAKGLKVALYYRRS